MPMMRVRRPSVRVRVSRLQSKQGRGTKGMEDQCRTVAGWAISAGWSWLLLRFRWSCRRLSCGHAAEDLPSGGCSEPGVGDAAGLWLAGPVFFFPDGGEPVVGHDDLAVSLP